MTDIVVFGAGQIAELAHYYFNEAKQFQIKAFVVDDEFYKDATFQGLPVVRRSQLEEKYPPARYKAFVALSYSDMNQDRRNAYLNLKAAGYSFVSYVSPYCRNFAARIGENCFILEDNTLQPFAVIGNNVVLWSGNHIGHHSSIGDHCFLTSHVVVSGGVTIGEGCFIGVNATLRDHITLGNYSFISAGALITGNVAEREVWKGHKAVVSAKTTSDIKKI